MIALSPAKASVLKTVAVTGAANYGTWDGKDYWIGSYGEGCVSKISGDGIVLRTYRLGPGIFPVQLAFDGTYIWVASADPYDQLIRLSPITGKFTTVQLAPAGDGGRGGIQGVLWDGHNIWAGLSGLSEVAEINPDTGIVIASVKGQSNVNGLAYSYLSDTSTGKTTEYLWAADSDTIGKINAKTMSYNYVGEGQGIFRLVIDGTYIYAQNANDSLIYKLDQQSGFLIATWKTGRAPNDIAFDGNYIWTVSDDNFVTVHNRKTGLIVATIPNAGKSSLTFDGTHMWSVDDATATVYKLSIGQATLPLGDP